MAISMAHPLSSTMPQAQKVAEHTAPVPPKFIEKDDNKLRETFDQFVGGSFYGMLFKTMRESVGKSAYFDGGQAEEIFQQQLDQVMTEKMTEATASSFTGPMFELFNLSRN